MRTAYKTKLGNIVVSTSGDDKYPGVYVSLHKGATVLAEVLLEVDQSEEEPVCKVHVWDTTKDDPICDLLGQPLGDKELEFVEY